MSANDHPIPDPSRSGLRGWLPALAAWLLLLTFLVVALVTLAGRVMVHQLAGSEQLVAEQLAAQLGLEVEIDSLAGRFQVLHPIVDVHGVRLRPPDGDVAMAAQRIQLEIDVLRSLLRRTLVPAALVLDAVTLELERSEDGQLRLRGGVVEADIAIGDILRFFQTAGYVSIESGEIHIHRPQTGSRESLSIGGVLEHRSGEGRGHVELGYRATADAPRSRGTLFYRLAGDPFGNVLPRGRFRVELTDLSIGAATLSWLPGLPLVEGTLDALSVVGDLHPETGVELVIEARASELDFVAGPRLASVDVGLQARGLGAPSGRLRLLRGSAEVDDVELDLDGLHVNWQSGHAGVEIRILAERFASTPLLRLLESTQRVPALAERWLAGLAPEGEVRDARLHIEAGRGRFALQARVDDLHLQPFQGAPGISDADLDVVLYEGGGWIDLDSGPFGLHFPDVFLQAWDYDRGRGRVDLAFAPGVVAVEGRNIEIVSDDVHVHGAFALHLPADEQERSLGLMIGIESADASRTPEFLPARLPPALRGWLVNAIRGGRMDSGGVVISGLLLPHLRSGPLRPELFFEISDATLAFDPRWPLGRDVAGRLLVERSAFTAQLEAGELGGLDLRNIDLRLDGLDATPGALEVAGGGHSEAAAGLAFLEAMHVDTGLVAGLAGWQASGRVGLDYELAIPLDGSPLEHVRIGVELAVDSLRVPMLNLDVDAVRGRLDYRHPGILSSSGLAGEMFGGPVTAELTTTMLPGASEVHLDFDGRADAARLAAWTTVDTLEGARGELDYRAALKIDAEGSVVLELASDAEAVTTGLPAPLAGGDGPLRLRFLADRDADWSLAVDWGGHSGAFRVRERNFVSGTMGLGTAMPELPEAGLIVRGDIEHIDLGAWFTALSAIEAAAVARGRPRTRSRTAADLDVDLDFQNTLFDGVELGPAALRVSGTTLATEVEIDSEPVAGRLLAVIDEPLLVELERLRWPLADTANGVEVIAASDFDPARVMAMNFNVERLIWGGREVGSLRFELRPQTDLLVVDHIEADLRGLKIGADAEGRSRFEWRFGVRPQTRYQGRISGVESSDVLEQWGLAPTLDAETFSFSMDLAWPGGPAELTARALDGRVHFEVDRGRFVQVDAGAGPLRVIGLFNFAAIARRMRLDFSDVYRRGMAFDEIDGVLDFDSGMVRSARPMKILGPSSSFRIAAELDVISQELDGDIIVTLPVSRNLPWYAAYAILLANPITGAGVLVAERVFRDQIDRFSSARYRLRGNLDQPEVTFVSIFADEVDLPARMTPGDAPDLDWLLEDPFFWPDEFVPQVLPEESDT
ncbi:MAG: hypothetical protein JJT88_10275 [Gammaproteobacteria bacterium]|nr:hypothetical protein [Gammaproteobacteria bacterium]